MALHVALVTTDLPIYMLGSIVLHTGQCDTVVTDAK